MLNRKTHGWLPKKDSLTGSLDDLTDEVKLFIAQEVPHYASLTADQWTHQHSGRTMMGTTAHWYDPAESVMKNAALELNPFQEHDVLTISEELADTCLRFLVAPTGITSDNHGSMVKALTQEEWEGSVHVRCVAHTINRLVKDALKVPLFNTATSAVKDVLKWIRRRFPAIRDAVIDPQNPKGPALRGPKDDDGKIRTFMRPPPDNNPTRWSDELDGFSWMLDDNNHAWFRFLQDGGLRGEAISQSSPHMPSHALQSGGTLMLAVQLIHSLLYPLGHTTAAVQSHSEPTMGVAWLHLMGLLLEWKRDGDLLESFKEFDRTACEEEDTSVATDRPTPGESAPANSATTTPGKRGRPRLSAEEKQRRLEEKRKAAEEKKACKGPLSSHPQDLIVEGKRERRDVNYKALDDGAVDPDGPSASEALETAPKEVPDNEMTQALQQAVDDAKTAITKKLLKHLAGFLSLKDEAVLLSVMLHPATRKLTVRGMTEDLTKHFGERQAAGMDALKGLLHEQLKAEGRVDDAEDKPKNTQGQVTAKKRRELVMRWYEPGADKQEMTLTDSIIDAFLKPSYFFDSSPLSWWRAQDIALRRVAAPFLAIQASSAASERVFSVAGYVGRARRASLADFRIEGFTLMRWNSEMVLKYLKKRGKGPAIISLD